MKAQLSQRKAVRLSAFGTFTFNIRGEPAFIISQEFANQFKLKQRSMPTPDNVPTAAANFALVSQKANVPRDVIGTLPFTLTSLDLILRADPPLSLCVLS